MLHSGLQDTPGRLQVPPAPNDSNLNDHARDADAFRAMESPMSSVQPKAALSVNDFCGVFSIGRSKFYQLVAEGRIKTLKLGRKTLVPATEVPALLDHLERT